jgi:hypothetical protein
MRLPRSTVYLSINERISLSGKFVSFESNSSFLLADSDDLFAVESARGLF